MKLNENREIWVNRINDFRTSNLTQKAWCEKKGVKLSTLRYWIRTLGESADIDSTSSHSSEFEFASVSISQDSSSVVVIEINDVKLTLTEGYDEIFLLRLIKTLKKI